jgi:hypothetical protein
MESKLPAIKVYDIDYSFIIKNYLNPEMWQKTWTLFQYKTFVVTLQIDYINCAEEKICFKVTLKDTSTENSYNYEWGRNTDKKAYCMAYYSLKINDINFLKREINSRVFDCITLLEKYNILASEECAGLEYEYSNETELLTQIAERFLDDNGVSNEDIRDAYINVYVNNNSKLDIYKSRLIETLQYQTFSDLYLVYANATGDEKVINKWEEILSENNNLGELKDEIKEYLEYMNTEEFEEDNASCLEEI